MKSSACFPESFPNESYYMVIFGSQRDPNWPQFSHTFATFIKAAANGDSPVDQALDTQTISWLQAQWPLVISPGIVILAFVVSAGVGIFFGYYPALRASRLDPIQALRYE